ncbi:DUF596 domain-containing protein [Pseudomonas cremoricolorata]|uniref:DUF596 domain-containing protein n=1 Tax=Pseudomonas cremoricolorata TaxID=157783 RepID=UPI00067644C8|nr:DUF596 domain-containing protein [Pseudomonas cremoricolorata]
MKISDETYRQIAELGEGFDVNALWLNLAQALSQSGFEERKTLFLQLLRRLLTEGRVKLAADSFLTGSVEEQVDAYLQAFPDEGQLDEDVFWLNSKGECWVPGGLVWCFEDGREVWT